MKQINFIKTIPFSEQLAIRQWYLWSLSSIIGSILLMGLIYVQQIRSINALKQQKGSISHYEQEYTAAHAHKKTNAETKTIYAQKAHKLKKHLYNPKTPHILIQALLAAHTKNNVTIQSINIQKHTLSLRGVCTQPDHALDLIHSLSRLPTLKNVTLISLEKQTGQNSTAPLTLTYTITSDIKK